MKVKNKVNEEKEVYMVFISRRFVLIFLLIIESIILLSLLLYGPQGYFNLQTAFHANKVLEDRLKKSLQEIEQLSDKVREWKTSFFLQEKYAREKLHMGKKDETVFFYE